MADSGTDVTIEVKVSQLDCQAGCLYTRIHAHVDSEVLPEAAMHAAKSSRIRIRFNDTYYIRATGICMHVLEMRVTDTAHPIARSLS